MCKLIFEYLPFLNFFNSHRLKGKASMFFSGLCAKLVTPPPSAELYGLLHPICLDGRTWIKLKELGEHKDIKQMTRCTLFMTQSYIFMIDYLPIRWFKHHIYGHLMRRDLTWSKVSSRRENIIQAKCRVLPLVHLGHKMSLLDLELWNPPPLSRPPPTVTSWYPIPTRPDSVLEIIGHFGYLP